MKMSACKPVYLAAVLTVLFGGGVSTAWAQNYATSPGGLPYLGDGTCAAFSNPCSLAGAVEDATDGGTSGNQVFLALSAVGATTLYEDDLIGAARIDMDVAFDTFLPDGTTGVAGNIELSGDVVIGSGDNLDIAPNMTLHYVGLGSLQLRDNASISGSGGFLVFGGNSFASTLQLGNPSVGCPGASPKVATIENLRVNKIGQPLNVLDQCPFDDESDLFITNRLETLNGTLDVGDNNLWLAGPTNDHGINGGVDIGAGTAIQGDGTLFIVVDPAALGGPPNNATSCYVIEGDGSLLMAFDKLTDAGVCIDLNETGNGGIALNRSGALYVKQATIHNGTFRNEGAARTEFWALTTITSSLEVSGPGGEVFPTDGLCGTGTGASGNESGVYFFQAVDIEEQLITDNTDDPATNPCVEGVWFMGDSDPGAGGAPAHDAADSTVPDPNLFSSVGQTYTSDGNVGIYLDSFDFVHNVAFMGNFAFDEAPAFVLNTPADAYPTGNLCALYSPFAIGNKVLFTGTDDQNLIYNTALNIQSVQVNKPSGSDLEIDENAASFLVDTSVEVIEGDFITNGLLDANSGTARDEGATVVVNRDGAGSVGVLDAGNAVRAYLGDEAEFSPRKVKYTGSPPHFTGDEIPGPPAGSQGGAEIFLDELEVYMSDFTSVITQGKDFTLLSRLTLTQGIFDVGSSKLKLGNLSEIAVGNGQPSAPEFPGSRGEFIFPSEHLPGFTVGDDGIDLLYFGSMDGTTGLAWPPSATTVPNRKIDPDVIRHVTINPVCGDDITLSLSDTNDAYRLSGNLVVGAAGPGRDAAPGSDVGTLNINAVTLESNAVNGNDTVVEVHNDADLNGTGLLRFIGDNDTDFWVETSADRLRFDVAALEVNRSATGHVTFDAEGVLSTAPPSFSPNNADELGTPSFTFINAAIGEEDRPAGDAGGVELLGGLDIFDVGGLYEQRNGEFLMAGTSSVGPPPTQAFTQEMRVGFSRSPSDMIIDDGEFFTTGGKVVVLGDFLLGKNLGQDPGDALFSLAPSGEHSVVGDFVVGPDTDVAEQPLQEVTKRNRYFLGGDCGTGPDGTGLFLQGDYLFNGTGDRFDDNLFLAQDQGLQGTVSFVGNVERDLAHRQDEDAFFCDVSMASRSTDNDGIKLGSNAWQNADGILTLEHGVINSDNETFDWIALNTDFETDLVGRNNARRGEGMIELGSRDSYADGTVQRTIERSNEIGGVITGGYLFPVGTAENGGDFFRALILMFLEDLGVPSQATVNYRQDLTNADVDFTPFDVPDAGGTLLTLDMVGNQFWQLDFDRIPAFAPSVRVEAEELPLVFDVRKLRLIQWDCDGTNPRLAGTFPVSGDPPGSAIINDRINGVPNVSQQGVDVQACQLFGIATNGAINPIGSILYAVPGSFSETLAPGGTVTRTMTVFNTDQDAQRDFLLYVSDDPGDFLSLALPPPLQGLSAPGDTVTATIAAGGSQVVEVTFDATGLALGAYAATMILNEVDAGPNTVITLQADLAVTLTPSFTIRLKRVYRKPNGKKKAVIKWNPADIAKNKVDFYIDEAPDGTSITRTANDGKIKLTVPFPGDGPFAIQACEKKSTATCSNIVLADFAGAIVSDEPDDDQRFLDDAGTEGLSAIALPAEFAVRGNFPNPFNPTTTIHVDLPEAAEVTVEIVDVLGRRVLVLPARRVEAGARRAFAVDGSHLASGTYFYRVLAQTATETLVETGRMLLVK